MAANTRTFTAGLSVAGTASRQAGKRAAAGLTSSGTRTSGPSILAQRYVDASAGNDANAGTSGSPWRTLGKACTAAIAGDEVIFRDGTYPGIADWTFPNGGTAAHPILYRADHTGLAILTWTAFGGEKLRFTQDFATFRGFEVTQDVKHRSDGATGTGYGVAGQDYFFEVEANHITIDQCTIHKNGYVAVKVTRGDSNTFLDNFCTITNNLFYDIDNMAIDTISSDHLVITGNTFRDCGFHPDGGFANNGGALLLKGGTRSIIIQNNLFETTGATYIQLTGATMTMENAIYLGGSTGGQWVWNLTGTASDADTVFEAYSATVSNNILRVHGQPITNGVHLSGIKDATIANNVFIGVGTVLVNERPANIGTGTTPWYWNPSNPNARFLNNICSGCTQRYSENLNNVSPGTIPALPQRDDNDYFTTGGSATGTGNITGDPLFVSTIDWHLQAGSPARGAGVVVTATDLLGIATDLTTTRDGTTRSIPWDMGAYDTTANTGTFSGGLSFAGAGRHGFRRLFSGVRAFVGALTIGPRANNYTRALSGVLSVAGSAAQRVALRRTLSGASFAMSALVRFGGRIHYSLSFSGAMSAIGLPASLPFSLVPTVAAAIQAAFAGALSFLWTTQGRAVLASPIWPNDPALVQLAIERPDGGITLWTYGVDAQVTRISTGVYQAVLTVTIPGTYQTWWTGTGMPAGGATVTF